MEDLSHHDDSNLTPIQSQPLGGPLRPAFQINKIIKKSKTSRQQIAVAVSGMCVVDLCSILSLQHVRYSEIRKITVMIRID